MKDDWRREIQVSTCKADTMQLACYSCKPRKFLKKIVPTPLPDPVIAYK